MPRQARLDTPGTLHHVILRGIEKRRIVNDVADRHNFVNRLGTLSLETKTHIYAWALMTNHAHILLRSAEIGLSNFMRRFLTGYAITYNQRHRRWGHLFQNRYKSIICDEDAYFSVKRQLRFEGEPQKIDALMAKMCKKEKVSVQELKSGSRRKDVSRARSLIALALVKTHGMALAEVARTVGVTTSAISKIVKRMSL